MSKPNWVYGPNGLLARRQQEQPATEGVPDAVVIRFLTVGGATVELLKHSFATRYLPKGRPHASHDERDVDGYRWKCLGCGDNGYRTQNGIPFGDSQYLPNEFHEARTDANQHANTCRSMPKPDGA